MTDDAELLRSYAENRSQAAFTELVRRHINLVYSVALRQVGHDAHLAQDVVQKVFADLARKAPTLSGRPVISGWLYRGARFAAADVVRSEQRRRRREKESEMMREIHGSVGPDLTDWEGVRPVLDEAMAELNEADRDAVALRFFENRSFPEIGGKLGLTEEAARKRVERALEKLHAWLRRRGIPSGVVALSTVLGGQGASAAPAGLVATVAGIGTGVGAGGTVLTFMGLTKLQIGITVGVVAIAAGGLSCNYQGSPPLSGAESPAKVGNTPAAEQAKAPPGHGPASAVTGPRLAQGGPPPADAAAAAQRAAQNRRMIIRRYGALYDQLGLTADQREKLTQLQLDDREASVDYGAANARLGVDASKDPRDFTVSVYKNREILRQQIIDLLGDEKYARFVAGDEAIRQTAVVEHLQKDLKVINARLSPAQAEQLQAVLHELGMHYVDDAVVDRAGAFLSPEQLDVLKTLQLRRAHGEQKEKVQQAIKANLPGATTGK